MENASKALIIAGAILLSILIIGFGVMIYNTAIGSVDTKSLDALAIRTFNDPLVNHEGRQIGTSVQDLISTLITNLTTNEGADEKLPNITYNGKGTASETLDGTADDARSNFTSLRTKIARTHNYYISFEYNEEGYVSNVIIDYNKPGSSTPANNNATPSNGP